MSNKNSRKMKVGIIGIGMVGEPIKRWFEEYLGYRRNKELFCYDTDPKKGFNDDINKADIVFVTVPTPANPDGSCNFSAVESAAGTISDGKIIVVKSTVPPGTIENLQKKHPRKRFIFNPEFLTESQAWLDFIKPDRQIVAYTLKSRGDTKEVLTLLPKASFERPWSSDYTKKDINATEAEVAKYAANVFGYIKVIYGNILADLCHAITLDFNKRKVGARIDYENVREVISADPRIGPAWLNVEHGNYCGVGGYCFPKDMNAFIKFAENLAGELSGRKKTRDAGLIKSLKKGIEVLKAMAAYNETLLGWQGLTVEDVSRHDREVVVNKRKPIRIHGKSPKK
jgi:UDPglucose 6-dehydrogenase